MTRREMATWSAWFVVTAGAVLLWGWRWGWVPTAWALTVLIAYHYGAHVTWRRSSEIHRRVVGQEQDLRREGRDRGRAEGRLLEKMDRQRTHRRATEMRGIPWERPN